MPTRNVSLSQHFDTFIDTEIAEGRYVDASEVVREGLRLLQQRSAEDRARIEWLLGAVQEGIEAAESGDYIVLSTHEDIDREMERIRREVRLVHTVEPASV